MTATQMPTRLPNMMQTSAALALGSPVMLGMAGAFAVQGYVWRMAMAGPVLAMRIGPKMAEKAETVAPKAKAPAPVAAKGAEARQTPAKADPQKAPAPSAQAATAPAATEKAQAPKASPATPATVEAPKAETPKAETPKAAPGKADASTPAPAAPKASAAAPATPAPQPKTAPKTDDGPVRPPALSAPRGGVGDDLTLLNGVGPKLAEALNGLGIHHFDQIAAWTPAHVAWIDENLGRPTGRASRGGWVEAAAVLAGTA